MSMHPGAEMQTDVAPQPGVTIQPGSIIQSDAELQPGMPMQPGAALQADNQRNILREATVIGQVFMTYLLLQHKDTLYILDQHAAHEKVIYEKLVREYEKNTPFSQMLVSPVVIELSNSEIQFLEEKIGLFNDIGYIYEKFGNNSIIIRSVPYTSVGGSIRNEFVSLLGHMMECNTDRIDMMAREALYRIACSSAVKAGSSMDKAESVQLIKDLSMLDSPFTCPHGRPTVIRIEKEELEKRFGRK
jgi:DNA mismatch repair protein MutL